MSHIKIRKDWELLDSETTPESVYMNRRHFLKRAGMAGFYSSVLFAGCTRKSPNESDYRITLSETEKALYPASRNEKYSLDGPVTSETDAATYNNFYEFTEVKEDVRMHAQKTSNPALEDKRNRTSTQTTFV